jgi:transposase
MKEDRVMAKKHAPKRLTRAERNRIISLAESQGLTAEQVEKKFGVSKWTYYGWRKRSAGTRGGTTTRGNGRRGGKAAVARAAMTTRSLRHELQAMLPALVREEITRTLADLVGRTSRGRGRRY